MPYIKTEARDRLSEFGWPQPKTAGELNYCITRLAVDYLDGHDMNYYTINEIIGVLECAKQEFYRRMAAPYEDVKIAENGDVYY